MRLAVLSDIHGNLAALDAVLADLQQAGGADRTWVLGDLVMAGPHPAECVQRIRDMQAAAPKTVEVIGGNTDRYLVTGQRRSQKIENEAGWGRFAEELRKRSARHLWIMERLSWTDAEFLLKTLRRELDLEIPGYGWAIGFHGGPGNDEFNMLPDTPDDVLLDALYDSEGHIAFCGHTHQAMDRDLGRWRVVNVGSIGLPNDDRRATYAIATFEGAQVTVDIRRVPFDSEAVIREMADQQHPDAEWVANVLRTGKSELEPAGTVETKR